MSRHHRRKSSFHFPKSVFFIPIRNSVPRLNLTILKKYVHDDCLSVLRSYLVDQESCQIFMHTYQRQELSLQNPSEGDILIKNKCFYMLDKNNEHKMIGGIGTRDKLVIPTNSIDFFKFYPNYWQHLFNLETTNRSRYRIRLNSANFCCFCFRNEQNFSVRDYEQNSSGKISGKIRLHEKTFAFKIVNELRESTDTKKLEKIMKNSSLCYFLEYTFFFIK